MKNEKKEFLMATEIQISLMPKFIKIEKLLIEKGQCFINSYRVAKCNNIEIIEGLIIIVDHENGAKAMPHVWNKSKDIHFDVTSEKIWTGKQERKEIKEIKYFSIKSHLHSDFKNGDTLEFCDETYENVNAITEILNKKINDE